MRRYLSPFRCLMLGAPSVRTAVLRVNSADLPGPRDGTTWQTAFETLGVAISAAVAQDEVWVAAGTYPELLTAQPGISLYGGFSSVETE